MNRKQLNETKKLTKNQKLTQRQQPTLSSELTEHKKFSSSKSQILTSQTKKNLPRNNASPLKHIKQRRGESSVLTPPLLRLQKALSEMGFGSRRAMEDLIAEGRVRVNKIVATLGTKVTATDQISVDGRVMRRPYTTLQQKTRILIYHKPEGVMCTHRDPERRATVFDMVPMLKHKRWIMVGRLDFNTSGLLLFTTNGELANRLMHPRYELEREYAVRILGEVTNDMLKKLKKGVELADGMAHFDKVQDAGGTGANHWYHVILKEGRKREVRRLWESQGVTISRLIRIRYGAVTLPRQLKIGKTQECALETIQEILRSVGL